MHVTVTARTYSPITSHHQIIGYTDWSLHSLKYQLVTSQPGNFSSKHLLVSLDCN